VFPDGIREATRQTLLTLWNVFSFFATYADLDGWHPDPARTARDASGEGHLLDRWILGELDATVAHVTESLEGFDALDAATALAAFVDSLSNWYVRRSRPRFWKSSDPAAHATLYECLVTTAELLAPFCPFLADAIYEPLTGAISVHLADWPVDKGRHDARLAVQVDASRRLVALGRAARTEAKVKVRQPLRRALLLHPGIELDPAVDAEIRNELNVKELEQIDTVTDLMSWTVVPNFRSLGPRLGPRVNEVKAALTEADGSELRRALATDGYVVVAGERLGPDDVEIRAERHESFALSEDDGWAVALDLEIDDELRREGQARELVRVLNDLRKTERLAISDRAVVRLEVAPELQPALDVHRDWIAAEVLATRIEAAAGDHALDVDGYPVRAGVRVATP
jgi:isoleucyl-tRNA synthetase